MLLRWGGIRQRAEMGRMEVVCRADSGQGCNNRLLGGHWDAARKFLIIYSYKPERSYALMLS